MKCLEDITVKQVKEMSYEELKIFGKRVAEEQHANAIRNELVKIIEMIEADNHRIES